MSDKQNVIEQQRDDLWDRLGDCQAERDNLRLELQSARKAIRAAQDEAKRQRSIAVAGSERRGTDA